MADVHEIGSITIDGVEFAPKAKDGDIKIIVLNNGFVYVGRVSELNDRIEVHDARNIIRWGTTGHLGQLADGPRENTNLGDSCNFFAYRMSINHIIDVCKDKWEGKL